MSESTTSLIQLLLMANGGRNNDWGVQANANFTKIETAIAGRLALASTGGTVVLTDDQARNSFLDCSGSLASNRIIEVPNRAKTWMVRNGHTLGGFTLTMKTASGSAITIPAGPSVVTCDGSNVLMRVGSEIVPNSNLAQMATKTVKANLTGSTATPSDVTVTDLATEMAAGTILVPATRAITTGINSGLAGGGSLSADRSLSVVFATQTQWRTGVQYVTLDAKTVWDAMAEVTLTDAANIVWDMSTGFDFVVTLGANRTMNNPTNTKVGQKGRLIVAQDGGGSRTLTWSANFEFANSTAPALSTAINARDVFYYDVRAADQILISLAGRAFG